MRNGDNERCRDEGWVDAHDGNWHHCMGKTQSCLSQEETGTHPLPVSLLENFFWRAHSHRQRTLISRVKQEAMHM